MRRLVKRTRKGTRSSLDGRVGGTNAFGKLDREWHDNTPFTC